MRWSRRATALAWLFVSLPFSVGGCESSGGRSQASVNRLEDSVVEILDDHGLSNGTGFIIESKGKLYVATAYHVVAGIRDPAVRKVRRDGDRLYNTTYSHCELEAVDPRADLALLSVDKVWPGDLAPLRLSPVAAAPGTPVRAAGFPGSIFEGLDGMGLVVKPPFTSPPGAVLSVLHSEEYKSVQETDGQFDGRRLLVLDGFVVPGQSGSPLLDSSGRVVGIGIMGDPRHEGQDVALAVEHLHKLLSQVSSTRGLSELADEDPESLRRSLERTLKGPLSLRKVAHLVPTELTLQRDLLRPSTLELL